MELIFGAFLGFLATLISSLAVDWAQKRSRTRAHKLYLRLEFAEAIKALDTIRTAYEHQAYYDYLLIDLLDKSVENLQLARQQAYLIRSRELQEAVFAMINRLAFLAKDMRGIQNFAYNVKRTDPKTGKDRQMTPQEILDRDKLVGDKRSRHMMEIIELKRETKDLEHQLQK